MGMKQDFTDIYTKSSVYYLRLQYLVICYLIVLAAAFFVLPMPREFEIDGAARLVIGGLLYIGFAVLMIYAPELFYPLIGKVLSPYKDAKEVERKFNALPAKEKEEVEKAIEAEYGVAFKKNGILVLTMNKTQRIATNMFFQCLLIELFCLVVLINQDHSLMISNPVTQGIAEFFSEHTSQTYRDGKFFVIKLPAGEGQEHSQYVPFAEIEYMAESIFFVYVVGMLSFVFKMSSFFMVFRPIFADDKVFTIVKDAKTVGKLIWALLGTLVMGFVFVGLIYYIVQSAGLWALSIYSIEYWAFLSAQFCVGFALIFIFFRFMEDWVKLIFRKFH